MTYVSVRMTSSFVILDCIFQLMLWGHGAQRRAPQTYAPDHGTQFRVPPGPFLQIWPLVASCFRLSVILLCRAFVDLPKFPTFSPFLNRVVSPNTQKDVWARDQGRKGCTTMGPESSIWAASRCFHLPPSLECFSSWLLELRTLSSWSCQM